MLRVLAYAALLGAIVWAINEFAAPEATIDPPTAPDEEPRDDVEAPEEEPGEREAPREPEKKPKKGLLGALGGG